MQDNHLSPGHRAVGLLVLLLLVLLTGCEKLFEDNATHLAFELEEAATYLRDTGASKKVVYYHTLDAPGVGYYVEITPSIQPYWEDKSTWGSVIVVSGETSGGTSYHNRFLYVPHRFYVEKPQGGVTRITLVRKAGRVSIAKVR